MENQMTKYRWKILALLFLATVINYLDRSIIGFLGPTLKTHVFNWTDLDYARIQISFKVAYAIGLICMGALIDKIGTKRGYILSIAIWSIFGIGHSLVTQSMGWIGFAIARAGLGFGEAGNFPAAMKTVAEWFPKKERAYATGLFNAGSNVGAILAPLLVPLVVSNQGDNWQFAFLLTAVFSAVWICLWKKNYDKPELHKKVSTLELSHIQERHEVEEGNATATKWTTLLGMKETWAFAFAKTTDAVWLFYLFWGGFFLNRMFGLELTGLALPIIIIYLMADLGSIGGGWFSSRLIKNGSTVLKARKIALLTSTVLIVPVAFAPQVTHPWTAVLLMGLAAAGHQAWSANLLTLVPDIFPKKATASIIGIGGMVGYGTGALTDLLLGKTLTESGPVAYAYAFAIGAVLYFVALFVLHLTIKEGRG